MKKVLVLLLLAWFAVLAACGTTPKATSVYSNVYGEHTLQSVERSIWAAATDLEWNTRKINSQTMEATLIVKRPLLASVSEHLLQVIIYYSKDSYSIEYKDSINMEYWPGDNSIIDKYAFWVDELDQKIQDELINSQRGLVQPASYGYVEKTVIVQPIEAPRVVVVQEAPLEEETVVIVSPAPVNETPAAVIEDIILEVN